MPSVKEWGHTCDGGVEHQGWMGGLRWGSDQRGRVNPEKPAGEGEGNHLYIRKGNALSERAL